MSENPDADKGSRLSAVADWLTRPARKWDPGDSGIGQERVASLDATHMADAMPAGPAPPELRPWDPDDRLWRPDPETPAPPSRAASSAPVPGPPTEPAEPRAAGPAPRRLTPMADTGSAHHPARRIAGEWPILLVLGGVAFGMFLALGDKDNLLSGTFMMGMTLLLAAALRLFLPTRTARSLAVRRRAIDVALYALLGFAVIVLGLLVQGIFGG